MKSMLRLTACGLALLPALPLAAQDGATPQDEADEEDPEMIVTGRGLDPVLSTGIYATTTLERETIIAAPSGRIEDVLRNVAGFQQFRRSGSRSSNPSAQGVTLRALGGNATSRALVLLDGVPLADPFFGYIPLSAIAPETLGTIRVTRGGGVSLVARAENLTEEAIITRNQGGSIDLGVPRTFWLGVRYGF